MARANSEFHLLGPIGKKKVKLTTGQRENSSSGITLTGIPVTSTEAVWTRLGEDVI